jgi:RNA polymerase sigma factor for flagellar operon FliA
VSSGVNRLSRESCSSIWARYRSTGDPEARELLLNQYLGLVHHIARGMHRRIPTLELGDMVSTGTIGLLRALDSYDTSRGLAFSTYAVRRIRGAILDDLRRSDWMPRSLRAKRRRLAAARADLERKLGRAPAPGEIAKALGIDLEMYWEWCDATGHSEKAEVCSSPLPLSEETSLEMSQAAAAVVVPDQQLLEQERVDRLRAAVSRLPERERMVVALCYYEELNLREIGELLAVTESRVCQIRSRAMKRLKAALATSPND